MANFSDPAYGWGMPNYPVTQLGGIFGGSQAGGILGNYAAAAPRAPMPLSAFLDPQVALPIAAQLIGGRTLKDSLAGGLAAAGPAMAIQKKRQAVSDWLKAGAPKDAKHPAAVALFEAAPEIAEKYIGAQFGAAGGTDTGLVPQWTRGPDGKWHQFLPSRTGVAKELQYPTGFEPQPQVSLQDMGTYVQPFSKAGGAPIGEPRAKDIAGKAREEKAGGAQGEAIAAWRSMSSKLPGLETVVKQLDDLSNKATYTEGGKLIDSAIRQTGLEPRESAVARVEYQTMVANQILPLLRDTFGAQFTQKEGETLMATMGDPDKAPAEKQAVLRSFIEQKRRDVEALAVQAGQAAPAPAAPSATKDGVVPYTEYFK